MKFLFFNFEFTPSHKTVNDGCERKNFLFAGRILPNFFRKLCGRPTGMYALLMAMMSLFLFSCEVAKINEEENDGRIEIPLKNDYLVFSDYHQFTNFLQSRDDYKTPESFHSLSSQLSFLMKDYLKNGSHKTELQNYYQLTEGTVPRPEYKYFSFIPGLNQDQLVEIEGELYKFDFDDVKVAMSGEATDFTSESTYKIEYSQVERRFYQDPTRAKVNVDCGYAFADLVQLYGSIFASLNIQSLYPLMSGYSIFQMWPDPNQSGNTAATISYHPDFSYSIDWQTYVCPSLYEDEYFWPQMIMSIPAPCSPKEVTLDLPYTRANWLGKVGHLLECEGLVTLPGMSKQFYRCN